MNFSYCSETTDYLIFGGNIRGMKQIFFLALSFLAVCGTKAQTETKMAEAIQLKESEYDFGKIPQGKPVFHFFDVTNTTPAPLKLDNVQASCGCTTPEWSKEAIPGNGQSQIKIGYNAAVEGHFEKFITITYNEKQTKQIKIKGEVWKAPSGAAPSNESVQFLKQQIQ